MDVTERYPSPSATSQSGGASPRKMDCDADADGLPPAKRRRTQAPPRRPRMTRHLDLDALDGSEAHEEELAYLLQALRKKKKIVVIAGAGISVSAGIPDFRSSTGLFTTLRGQHGLKGSGKHLFDASVYKHDSSTTSFHSMVRELAHMTETAQPTPFHHMLASIAHEGRLMRLYSQNVDCIDTKMPPLATHVPLNVKGPWPITVQLHGGLAKMVCSKCGELADFDGTLFDGPEAPACSSCTETDMVRTAVAGKRSHGIGRLRPRIVLYNEYNPDEEAIGMVSKADLRRGADAVIVVGTSLKIPGVRRLVKELCHTTRSRRDGFTAWINVDAEPQGVEFKDCWDLVVRGSSDHVATLAGIPHWDVPMCGADSCTTTGDRNIASNELEIVLEHRSSKKPPSGLVVETLSGVQTTDANHSLLLKSAKSRAPTSLGSLPSTADGIPTPVPSPRPHRKRLPDSRQRKLPFQQVTKPKQSNQGTVKAEKAKAVKRSAKESSESPAHLSISAKGKKESTTIKVSAKATKERHSLPNQRPQSNRLATGRVASKMKEDKVPTKSIALTFRATKNVPVPTLDGKKRKALPSGKSPRNHSGAADSSGPPNMSEFSTPPRSTKDRLSIDVSLLPSPCDMFAPGKENGLTEDVRQTLGGHTQKPFPKSCKDAGPCTPPASQTSHT
ncbi:hypothetical protein SEPCBS57363_005917 [Sporothrix epigloea]|uniref:Deacetylase sirtuin-type domain-containing protein n=1 Tax=Sporothrix epigloea TaxID=1892477 RepID=A0ABP0E1E8_9PEZI